MNRIVTILLLLCCMTASAATFTFKPNVLLTNGQSTTVDLGTNIIPVTIFTMGHTNRQNIWLNSLNASVNPLGYLQILGSSDSNNWSIISSNANWYASDMTNASGQVCQLQERQFGGYDNQTNSMRYFSFTFITTNTAYSGHQSFTNQTTPTAAVLDLAQIDIFGASTNEITNCISQPIGTSNVVHYAVNDLNKYLSLVTGNYVPIVTPSETNSFSGYIFSVQDDAANASTYTAMTNNLHSGTLPTNDINIYMSGTRTVIIDGWPYRNARGSTWYFLRKQGVVFGGYFPRTDYIPSGSLDLSFLPVHTNLPARLLGFNADGYVFYPFNYSDNGSMFDGANYLLAQGWNHEFFHYFDSKLGQQEIPLPTGTGSVKPENTLGFAWPHDFGGTASIPPISVQATNLAWQNSNGTNGAYIPAMGNSGLALWLMQCATNWNVASPSYYSSTEQLGLNYGYLRGYFFGPIDSSTFSSDSLSVASNSVYGNPTQQTKSWVNNIGSTSWSGSYNAMLQVIATAAPTLHFSGLAYQQVFDPPTFVLATNISMAFAVMGYPDLPFTSVFNQPMSNALSGWKTALPGNMYYPDWNTTFNRKKYYGYDLLFVDFWQTNAQVIVPMANAMVARAQWLAANDMLDGDCQSLVGNNSDPSMALSLTVNGLDFYAYTASRQNTNLTAAQITTNYCLANFGEAAASMYSFYKVPDDFAFTNNVSKHMQKGYDYYQNQQSLPLWVLTSMSNSLTSAYSAATNNWVIDRLNIVSNSFAWTTTALRFTTNAAQFGTVYSNATYLVTNSLFKASLAVGSTNQFELRSSNANLNGASSEFYQRLNFQTPGWYIMTNVWAANYYYTSGNSNQEAIFFAGPSSTTNFSGAIDGGGIGSGAFSTNSVMLYVPTADIYDVGMERPGSFTSTAYLTLNSMSLTYTNVVAPSPPVTYTGKVLLIKRN